MTEENSVVTTTDNSGNISDTVTVTSGQVPNPTVQETAGEGKDETFTKEYVEQLRREAAENRVKRREAEDRVAQYEREKLSELERAQAEAADAKKREQELLGQLRNERIANAVRARAAELNFHNTEDAVQAIDLTSITVDEDGRPDGRSIKAKVEGLVKERPYLVKQIAPGSGDGGPTSPPQPTTWDDKVDQEEKRLLEQGGVKIPL